MMGLMRVVAKSNRSIQRSIQNQGLTLPLCRQFSTQMETPQKDNSSDSFLRNPSSGLVYGRLFVTGKHTRKSDVINMLGSSRLSPDDVRFEYNMNYAPVSVTQGCDLVVNEARMDHGSRETRVQGPAELLVISLHLSKSEWADLPGICVGYFCEHLIAFRRMIQFPSRNSYEATLREGSRKGGLFRMERVGRQQWDSLPRYDGKTILLQGVPRNAVAEDVERFLAGCQYDASAIQMFGRPQRAADRPPTRTVFVEFPSQAKATHAFITKNRGFCLNNQITVRLLQ